MGMDIGQKRAMPGRARPNMNVTPLVDVVLVLLIIFMVIAPLLAKQFSLSLPNKPDARQEVPDNQQPIVITATKGGAIEINREVVSRSDFSTKLRRVLAARQQRTVFFDADDDAAFGDAVDILDLARAGGGATIAVLTAPIPSH